MARDCENASGQTTKEHARPAGAMQVGNFSNSAVLLKRTQSQSRINTNSVLSVSKWTTSRSNNTQTQNRLETATKRV